MAAETDLQPNSDQAAGPAPAAVGARIVATLVLSAGLSLACYELLALVLRDGWLRAAVSVALAGGLLGVATAAMVMQPILRSRAELHDRYQAALADALRDPLTGLGNHRAFQEELDRQVEHSQRYGGSVSLVLIDLDEFKQVNDSEGHAAGDRTLAAFGQLVAAAVRRVDTAFRIGGDEFALLLPHTEADGAHIVARRLLAAALQPSARDHAQRPISFSAGISALPDPASSRAQLYSQADSAMYAAKRAGRTEVVVFDPSDRATASEAGAAAAIVEVIARGQLRPVYQPVVDLASGGVLGYEGLIRPVDPSPFNDPAGLFAAAEASGHVVELDMACLDTIVAGATRIPPEAFLALNITPRTVEAPEFSTAALLSILARHGFPPERLVMELTEHQPITDIERVRLKLDTCRRAGIRIAADDLGAGNAGLRLLSELRFDVVKVDLGLVQRSAPGAQARAVIESIVSFASRTGALIIGEGVEYDEQVEQLMAMGVSAGQGYLLGRPGPLPVSFGTADGVASAAESPESAGAVELPHPEADMDLWRQSIGLPVSAAGAAR